MIKLILVLFLCFCPIVSTSAAANPLQCTMLDGNGHGMYRLDLTTNCQYVQYTRLNFRFAGVGPTFLEFNQRRTMTRSEKAVPTYWLQNLNQLSIPTGFSIRTFLQNAASASSANSYVLTNSVLDSIDLVFGHQSGRVYVIRVYTSGDGQMIGGHVPAAFWFGYPS